MNKIRLGVYAGSFNPFHQGHFHIFNQAKKQFDNIFLAVGMNPDKDYNDVNNRFPDGQGINHITFYKGFLSDELERIEKEYNADVTLIRGLRNEYDLNSEQNMISFIREMYPELKVVYFLCEAKYQHISSSAIRSIRGFSSKEYEKYLVPSK